MQEQLLGSQDGKATLLKREYQYDAVGQLTDIHDTRRGQLAYQYDPIGRLLQATSRLGVETFAFDPAGNLLDDKHHEPTRPLERAPKRNRLMDNLLREYAGTHYTYDERGNLSHRLHNGVHAKFTWDLFDRLQAYSDDKLKVEYSYDALGRRLHKHSTAHYWNKPQAGTGWNELERAKRQRELNCGFTLFGWDGDTLAWESSPAQDEGDTGRTVHYLYEPGSFVPVAQALRNAPIRLHRQPDWSGRSYDIDQDPLWQEAKKPQPLDAIAWYQCDHLGTPMELTDHNGEVAWSAQYKAWGEVKQERSAWAKQVGLSNPIRFQGQYHDHETGLHYNRYRYYDPEVGRFVGQDPIGYAGGLNLFAYTPNPICWVDTLGLTPTPLNEPGYTVYGLYRPNEDTPYYVGHTKQAHVVRESQHAGTGRLGDAELKPISENLTYTQSKGQEQYYREVYDTKKGFPANVIEPIDKSRQDERGRSHVAEYEKIKAQNICEI